MNLNPEKKSENHKQALANITLLANERE